MKKDRHSTVEVSCENCGEPFLARRERVEKGQGRFCSKICFDVVQREKAKQTWGRKDLARCYKIGSRYVARWYGENGEMISVPYGRWWWEMNTGEIPDGMTVLPKDNNALNIDPSNFYIGTRSSALVRANQTRRQDPAKWAEYRNKLSKKQTKMWDEGKFDHIRGSGNYRWRNGASKETYPKEFHEISDFIRSRDNHMCQICGREIESKTYGRVHHRDGNKNNNDQNNLIYLCVVCHGKVHSKNPASPPIMALREELYWN